MKEIRSRIGKGLPENSTAPDQAQSRRGRAQAGARNDVARSPQDYRGASGRDHPAESEHDHEHQKLNGESAEMANEKSPRVDPADR
jgi:hypothetical protein